MQRAKQVSVDFRNVTETRDSRTDNHLVIQQRQILNSQSIAIASYIMAMPNSPLHHLAIASQARAISYWG